MKKSKIKYEKKRWKLWNKWNKTWKKIIEKLLKFIWNLSGKYGNDTVRAIKIQYEKIIVGSLLSNVSTYVNYKIYMHNKIENLSRI